MHPPSHLAVGCISSHPSRLDFGFFSRLILKAIQFPKFDVVPQNLGSRSTVMHSKQYITHCRKVPNVQVQSAVF